MEGPTTEYSSVPAITVDEPAGDPAAESKEAGELPPPPPPTPAQEEPSWDYPEEPPPPEPVKLETLIVTTEAGQPIEATIVEPDEAPALVESMEGPAPAASVAAEEPTVDPAPEVEKEPLTEGKRAELAALGPVSEESIVHPAPQVKKERLTEGEKLELAALGPVAYWRDVKANEVRRKASEAIVHSDQREEEVNAAVKEDATKQTPEPEVGPVARTATPITKSTAFSTTASTVAKVRKRAKTRAKIPVFVYNAVLGRELAAEVTPLVKAKAKSVVAP